MKMKEVIAATGLPEKTIRYYEDRALITPETYRQNGRTYHEYSQEDVEALKGIMTLRQAQFTLEEIHRMQQDAGTIPEILSDHHNRLEAQRESLEALSDLSDTPDWMTLVREIESRSRANPDYVPVLRFGALDPESEEERAAELRSVRDRHARSVPAARIAIISLSIACVALAVILIGVLVHSDKPVTVSVESTTGWYYYLTTEGLMRTQDPNQPGELICGRTNMASTINYRVGEHQIFVIMDNKLYSMDPDGKNRHAYKPKFTSAYAGGDESIGLGPISFHLHEDELIVLEVSGGQLGGGDRYLVRVPVDGSRQGKLNYELQYGYEYYTALRGDILYILELDQSSDGNTSVIRYDLTGDTVMDRTTLRLPLSRALYMGVEPDWYFGSWNSATGNGNATTTDLYQVHSDLIQGDGEPVKLVDRLATISGAVHTVYGHYAVYQGDYETIPVDDPLGIAENEVYAQARHTYLMNLETGDQFLLDQDYRYLNFFPDGLLLTGMNYETGQILQQWLEYP